MDINLIINTLKDEVTPAIGCTEPVAVALAGANAFRLVEGRVKKIKLLVSSNVYKNAKAVGIPGCKETGVEMAAALGVSIMRPRLDLTIFNSLKEEEVKRAEELKRNIPINTEVGYDLPSVYIDIEVKTEVGCGKALISGKHTNLILLARNDQVLFDKRNFEAGSELTGGGELLKYPLEELIRACISIDPDKLDFLFNGVEMNLKTALKGLELEEGLKIGSMWEVLYEKKLLNNELTMEIARYTAAACDARMSGVKSSVMSSAGSGNQGLLAVIPIALVAREHKASKEEIIRALAVSHLVTLYIKEYIGRLSPLCGCSVAAGAGAGAGTVYLLGGKTKEIARVIKNIISALAGMICDGGKVGCALKLCTSATTAWCNSLLALEGLEVPSNNGILAADLQQTIYNLKRLSCEGMKEVDRVIISIQQEQNNEGEKRGCIDRITTGFNNSLVTE